MSTLVPITAVPLTCPTATRGKPSGDQAATKLGDETRSELGDERAAELGEKARAELREEAAACLREALPEQRICTPHALLLAARRFDRRWCSASCSGARIAIDGGDGGGRGGVGGDDDGDGDDDGGGCALRKQPCVSQPCASTLSLVFRSLVPAHSAPGLSVIISGCRHAIWCRPAPCCCCC
eukprot:3194323-Rhodomonas_salina.3